MIPAPHPHPFLSFFLLFIRLIFLFFSYHTSISCQVWSGRIFTQTALDFRCSEGLIFSTEAGIRYSTQSIIFSFLKGAVICLLVVLHSLNATVTSLLFWQKQGRAGELGKSVREAKWQLPLTQQKNLHRRIIFELLILMATNSFILRSISTVTTSYNLQSVRSDLLIHSSRYINICLFFVYDYTTRTVTLITGTVKLQDNIIKIT